MTLADDGLDLEIWSFSGVWWLVVWSLASGRVVASTGTKYRVLQSGDDCKGPGEFSETVQQ